MYNDNPREAQIARLELSTWWCGPVQEAACSSSSSMGKGREQRGQERAGEGARVGEGALLGEGALFGEGAHSFWEG